EGPGGRAAEVGSTARAEEGAPEPVKSRGREDPAAAAKEDGRGGDANDRPREAARSRDDVARAQAAPREPEAGQTPTGADADDMRIARDVPGASLSVPSPVEGDGPVLAVYADAPVTEPAKGLVLLLHACTHSAYKFFARSGRCEECVGLSEEMRIARIALRNGYLPVAVSSADRDTGCWSKGRDAERVRAVLDAQFLRRYRDLSVVAVGASSGGALAAELALGGLADGALVMVMDLTDGTVGRLKDAGGSDGSQAGPVVVRAAPADGGLPRRAGGGDGPRRGRGADRRARALEARPRAKSDVPQGPDGVGLEGRPDGRPGGQDEVAGEVRAGEGQLAAGQGAAQVLGVPRVLQRVGRARPPVLRGEEEDVINMC
ncbi:hypothetical protein THAOC_07926, partial [Thalassiosira oceanica]